MTTPCQEEPGPRGLAASVVIVDFLTGRMKGGHQDDYLAALERALAEFRSVTVAPYRDVAPAAPSQFAIRPPGGRLRRYLAGIRVCRQFLNADKPTLIIFPNNDFRDYVVFAVAALLRRRAGRGLGVFVMRRDGAGITGSARLGRALERLVAWLCDHAPFFMVSDARAAMDHWRAKTGKDGPIVSIPLRQIPPTAKRRDDRALVVGLLGSFRAEKGAGKYNELIELALAEDSDLRVECQLSMNVPPAEYVLAQAIVDRWSGHPRVTLHIGHLDAEGFSRLLHAVDVVVLPYDAASYGKGTSGIMFEAIGAGRIALITPIVWAVSEYGDHPNVVWLPDTEAATLRIGLRNALDRARDARLSGTAHEPDRDRFRETWIAALVLASSTAARSQPACRADSYGGC